LAAPRNVRKESSMITVVTTDGQVVEGVPVWSDETKELMNTVDFVL
jgi:hypothetical protein